MGAASVSQVHSQMTDPAQRKQHDASAYYASRRTGNWLILVAILVFVAFTLGVTMAKFDVAEFMSLTHEYEAQQQSQEAQRTLEQNLDAARQSVAGEGGQGGQ